MAATFIACFGGYDFYRSICVADEREWRNNGNSIARTVNKVDLSLCSKLFCGNWVTSDLKLLFILAEAWSSYSTKSILPVY